MGFKKIYFILPRYGVTSVVTRTAREFATTHNSKARRRLPNDIIWSGVAPGFSCSDNHTDMEKDVLERKSLGRFSTVVGNENEAHGRLIHACLGFFSELITGKLAKRGGHLTFQPNDIILWKSLKSFSMVSSLLLVALIMSIIVTKSSLATGALHSAKISQTLRAVAVKFLFVEAGIIINWEILNKYVQEFLCSYKDYIL